MQDLSYWTMTKAACATDIVKQRVQHFALRGQRKTTMTPPAGRVAEPVGHPGPPSFGR